jgi:hypothetical protein
MAPAGELDPEFLRQIQTPVFCRYIRDLVFSGKLPIFQDQVNVLLGSYYTKQEIESRELNLRRDIHHLVSAEVFKTIGSNADFQRMLEAFHRNNQAIFDDATAVLASYQHSMRATRLQCEEETRVALSKQKEKIIDEVIKSDHVGLLMREMEMRITDKVGHGPFFYGSLVALGGVAGVGLSYLAQRTRLF